MPAHIRRGATLAAMLLLLAVTTTPLSAHAQAATHGWSTYVGGNAADQITGITHFPSNGGVVAVGWTSSPDFPRPPTGSSTGKDAFVATFATTGFPFRIPFFVFGGTGDDVIHAVALGAQEQIYVVGMTQTAALTAFTNRTGALTGPNAAFLARISRDGAPEWLMYLDGPGSETATGVTVSGTDIYVTGYTDSCDFMGTSTPCLGNGDGFVVKVANAANTPTVQWRKLVTGNLDDKPAKVLVEGTNILVVGTTASTAFNAGVQMKNFYQGGASDILAARLDTTLGALTWVYYLGGSGDDSGAGIARGANGEIVVVGTTGTDFQARNISATRMSTDGVVRGSQEWGGSDDEVVSSVTADASGNVYIGGKTFSTNFPLVRPFDSTAENSLPPQEGFVTVLPAGGGPGWSSWVGGNSSDDVLALSIHNARLVIAGDTSSDADLIVNGTYDSSRNPPPDGFLVAVDTDISPPEPGTVNDRPQSDDVPVDIQWQTSRDTISANWAGFKDDQSGIDRYEWAIGTRPGTDDVSPFTPISNSLQRSFTKTGLTLIEGRTYYSSVRGINGAGLTVTVSSDGVRIGEPPVVTDGGTNGGTDGGPDGGGTADGGTDGGTDGGPDGGGSGGELEEDEVPLMGWSCTAAGAGLPMLLGLLALLLLAGRRGSQPR